MPNLRKLGADAEANVLNYLISKGYHNVCSNYYTPYGEIDLIVMDSDTYVFVEVKARSSVKYGSPSEAVTKKKQARYIKAALHYFAVNNILDYKARFDVAEVFLNSSDKNSCINYMINAFDCSGSEQFY